MPALIWLLSGLKILFSSTFMLILIPAIAMFVTLLSLVDDISTILPPLPEELKYYMHIFEISFIFQMIFAAYTIRFLIRRIPIIG